MQKTNEKGASMVEILGVLAVISVMATGMFSGIATIQSKIKLTKAQSQVSSIIKSMREHFSAYRPTSSSSEAMYKIGVFDNLGDDKKSVHVFGGEMLIQLSGSDADYVSSFSESDPTFKLVFKNISPKICFDLLSADWGSDPSSGLAEISVGSEGVTFQWSKDFTGDEHHPLPPSTSDAMTECAKSPSFDLSWEYFF